MDPSEPHIRVLLDAIKDTGGVSNASGVLQPTVLGGLVNLWALVRREMNDLVTEGQLRGCFGPVSPDLILALVSFGFLTAEGASQWRVRGAESLLRVARQKSDAGRSRAAGAQRDSRGRMVASGTPAEHQRNTSGTPAEHQPITQTPIHPPTQTPNTTTDAVPLEEVVVVDAWNQVQDVREKAGFGREARRPKGFAEWLKVALAAYALMDLLRGYEFFLHDHSIKAPTHPTAVFMRDGVWSTRIPPPLPPEPANLSANQGAPDVDADAAVVWDGVLDRLRADGKTYALGWMQRLVPVGLGDGTLTLWGPDRFFLDWLEDHYGALLSALCPMMVFLVSTDVPRRPLKGGST